MVKNRFNIIVLFRILIGGLLLFSGIQKAIVPYQNFLYIIQTYNFLPTALEDLSARLVPWAEVFIGIFLVLGLWVRLSASAAALFFAMFIGIISQALIRGLPIDECGCFGEWLSVPPIYMIVFDAVTLGLLILIIRNPVKASIMSLDRCFEQ